MVQFWLDNPIELFNMDNFNNDKTTSSDKYIKILNMLALLTIVIGTGFIVKTKKSYYFAIMVLILSLTILIRSNISTSLFTTVEKFNKTNTLTNAYDTGIYLVKAINIDPNNLNNLIYVNSSLNLNKGDIIAFNSNGNILETNIITDINYTVDTQLPVIILLNNLKNNYSKYTTRILKVSDSSPNIVNAPDGNESISKSTFGASNNLDGNRKEWDLELANMKVPGFPDDTFKYQGPPYGDLNCRQSDTNNPMGTINVTEYDNYPTMYGTCNVGNTVDGKPNDKIMTENQEATVSQRVDDLLFHKGNSQASFTPMPVDTLPNNQEAFANFCYRSPTNLLNPKYGSIFVNDPEKLKLIMKLTKPTGTENGGG